ncbi:hypothetical protein D3C81_2154290 [compost metagenome]
MDRPFHQQKLLGLRLSLEQFLAHIRRHIIIFCSVHKQDRHLAVLYSLERADLLHAEPGDTFHPFVDES